MKELYMDVEAYYLFSVIEYSDSEYMYVVDGSGEIGSDQIHFVNRGMLILRIIMVRNHY
jgi:hypothetical protein